MMVVQSVAPWQVYKIGQDFCPDPFTFVANQLVTIMSWNGPGKIAFKAEESWELIFITTSSLVNALNAAEATIVGED